MCAEALTQEEIDALLSGKEPPKPSEKPIMITPAEEDATKAYAGMVVNAGRDVLSTLLGQDVTQEVVEITETDGGMIGTQVEGDSVVAELLYKGQVQGKSVFITSVDNALKISNQMTGGGGESDFGDLEESAFGEAIQNVFGSVNSQISNQTGSDISIEPVDITTKPDDMATMLPESPERQILVKYNISSGDITGPVYQVIPRNLLNSIANAGSTPAEEEGGDARAYSSSAKAPEVMSAPPQFGMGAHGGMQQAMLPSMPSVDIQNLELILDISVEVKVELGRTKRKIKDVLELGPGSVVELERLAGEPVDILVNDKLFAKGEVVVIDENFGVRITDILSIQERIEALK